MAMTVQVENFNLDKIQNRIKDTYDTFGPITRLLKIFAINSNIGENNSKPLCIFRCLLTLIVLGLLITFSLYYKVAHVYSIMSPSVAVTDAVQISYDYCQYIVDFWFVSKYGRSISSEYFIRYERIDKALGMTDYTKITRKLKTMIGVFFAIWLGSSACDFAAWMLSYEWRIPVISSLAYVFLLIKILTTLDLSSHVTHIEARLKILADIVQHEYSSAECLPGPMGDLITNQNWLYSNTTKPRLNSSKLLNEDCKWLSRCYLQLTEQVKFINRMFGIRILLNTLSLLIDIVRFTNLAVRIMMRAQQTTYDSGYFPAVSTLLRQMTCVAVIISLVHHCEKAYSQKDRIVSLIDHLLIDRNPSDKIRSSMTELRGLVLARPISFNMAKFFRLDNSFLVSVTSVVVTYTIILLQSMN